MTDTFNKSNAFLWTIFACALTFMCIFLYSSDPWTETVTLQNALVVGLLFGIVTTITWAIALFEWNKKEV